MISGLPAMALPEVNQTIALALLAGLGTFASLVGLYILATPAVVNQRLAHFVAGASGARRSGVDFGFGTSHLLQSIDRQLVRRNRAATTRLLLQRAHLPVSVSEFIGMRIGVGLIAAGAIAYIQYDTFGWPSLVLGAVVGFACSFVPSFVLGFLASRRVGKLELQLPDALDTVAASLQAGAGLSQALLVITKEMTPPISEEFQRVLREVEIGLSINEALENMATRMGSEDFDLVATTIAIQSRIGGNLVEILHTITHTIRERLRIRGEIQVLTAMQRMSAFVIGAVPPGLALVIYGMNRPYIMHLFVPGIGLGMLIVAVVMTLAGILALRKITQIEI